MALLDQTNSSVPGACSRPLRLLAVIASFGDKNLDYLRSIIRTYLDMPLAVNVVVVSNAPKNLGPEIKVVVGLPDKNPWSLPFAHKPIMAENADAYDLFIYSEDDIAVTEGNIRAFLDVSKDLAQDEIAGFLRYELDSAGNRSLPEVHGSFHWKPESVAVRGSHLVAEFSGLHAAFYLLTQAQLKKSIASGGFLRAPCEGRYDMLCTAATDPYTNCGFRKVICISTPEDFLIHHLPNRYVGQFGISFADFLEQIRTLQVIGREDHPASSLGIEESKLRNARWSKGYYEPPADNILALVPGSTKTILSIGCGWGITEAALQQRGCAVTALPLDSVIGAVAERRKINVIYGTLDEGLSKLAGQTFDVVLVTNLLHLCIDPAAFLRKTSPFIRKGGTLIIAGPNFEQFAVLIKRILGKGDYQKLRKYSSAGINAFAVSRLAGWARQVGLQPERPIWSTGDVHEPISGAHGKWHLLRRNLRRKMFLNGGGRFTAENWLLFSRK